MAEFGHTIALADGSSATFVSAVEQAWDKRDVPKTYDRIIRSLGGGARVPRAKQDRILHVYELLCRAS